MLLIEANMVLIGVNMLSIGVDMLLIEGYILLLGGRSFLGASIPFFFFLALFYLFSLCELVSPGVQRWSPVKGVRGNVQQ